MKKNNVTSLKTLDREKYNQLRDMFNVHAKIVDIKKLLQHSASKSQEKMFDIYLKCLEKRRELKKELETLDKKTKTELLKDKIWDFRDVATVSYDMFLAINIDYVSVAKKYTEEYKKELLRLRKDTFDFVIELSKTEKKFKEIKAKKLTNAALKANSR